MLNNGALNSLALNGGYLQGSNIDAEVVSHANVVSAVVETSGNNAFFPNPAAVVSSTVLSGYAINGDLLAPINEVEVIMLHGSMIEVVVEPSLPNVESFIQLYNSVEVTSTIPSVQSSIIVGNVFSAEVEQKTAVPNAVIAAGYVINADVIAPLQEVFSGIEFNNLLSAIAIAASNNVNSVIISDSLINAAIVQPRSVVLGVVDSEFNNIFTTYAMNLDGMQLTKYTNFESLAMAKINGAYLSVTQDGIYSLGGDTDDGVEINARVRFGMDDMGSPNHKRVQYVYVGSRGAASLQMLMDHDEISSIHNATHQDNGMGTRRIKLGKGNKSRYWQPEITGNRFEIDSMSIEAEVLSRKVA